MSEDQKPSNGPIQRPEQSKAVEANIEARAKELTNVNRIVTNALNLIIDTEIKGGHAGPVSEILGWLTGFSQSLTTQIKTLEATLPKKEEKPTKAELPEAEVARVKAVTPTAAKDNVGLSEETKQKIALAKPPVAIPKA